MDKQEALRILAAMVEPKPKRGMTKQQALDILAGLVQTPRQADASALLERAVREEVSRHPNDPRPSRVFASMVKRSETPDRLLADRALWLQQARERLPNQPDAPTRLAPKRLRSTVNSYGVRVEVPADHLAIVEPFAGAGLMGLAFHIEGCTTIDVCEYLKWPVESMKANNDGYFGLQWSDVSKLKTQDARTWVPARIEGGVDAIVGGVPCKAWSDAARLGRTPDQIGPAADDNYFPLVLDWICDLQPRMVLIENVSKLLTVDSFRRWFQREWGRQLDALGYTLLMHRMFAADYGTPQNRDRALIVCVPKGARYIADPARLKAGPQITHAKPHSPEVQSGDKLPWVSMHDRLVSGCCAGYGLVDCVHLGNEQIRCRTCHNGSNFDPAPNTRGDDGRNPIEGVKVKGRRGTIPVQQYMVRPMSRLRPDQLRYLKYNPADMAGAFPQARTMQIGRTVTRYLSKTVVPMFAKFPEGLMVPPGLDAWANIRDLSTQAAKKLISKLEVMSARDAAKLQDVPQYVAFRGPRSAVFTQIGMGVPVNLGRAMARYMRQSFGLPVRKPWYDGGFDTWPANVPMGLWPIESLDICAGFPGVLEGAAFSHEQALYDWSQINPQVYAHQVRKRPAESLRPLTRQQEAEMQSVGEAAWAHFPDGYIDGRALWQSGWRPKSPYDAPEPFEDVGWFAEYLRERSVDPSWYTRWATLYRRRFAGTFMEATATTDAGPIETVWPLE